MKRWLALALVALGGCPDAAKSPPAPAPAPIAATQPALPPEPDKSVAPLFDAGVEAGLDAAAGESEQVDRAPLQKVPGLLQMYTIHPPADAREKCGAHAVDTFYDPSSFQTRIEIKNAKGQVVKKLTPQNPLDSYRPAWCFDVTGDGAPELAVTRFSGGAHCCHEHTLLSLAPQLRTLLVYPAGNGSYQLLTPNDLDGKAPWELVDSDDLLVQYGSTAYAFTRFLPVVFTFEKGRYVRATRRFASYLVSERETALATLEKCAPECWTDGEGEYVLGLSILIGDWDRLKKAEAVPPTALARLESLRQKIAPRLLR